MSRFLGVLGILVILVGVMVFARLNGAESATVELGVATFQDVPITFVLFAGLILGMVVMLLAGLHADLKVRRLLRQRLADDEAARAGRGASAERPVPKESAEPLRDSGNGRDDRPEDLTVPDRE